MRPVATAPIFVTLGGREYVTITVTEDDGRNIQADVITAQLTRAGVRPTSWRATEAVSGSGATRVVRLLVDSTVCATAGTYDLWVKINDGTEVPIRKLSGLVIAG